TGTRQHSEVPTLRDQRPARSRAAPQAGPRGGGGSARISYENPRCRRWSRATVGHPLAQLTVQCPEVRQTDADGLGAGHPTGGRLRKASKIPQTLLSFQIELSEHTRQLILLQACDRSVDNALAYRKGGMTSVSGGREEFDRLIGDTLRTLQ